MSYEKYGLDRHRKRAVLSYCRAVKAAERKGAFYGLVLERQPDNRHDPNAIAVYGAAMVFPWFRRQRRKEWHIGFVPAETAAAVVADLEARDVPIAAELYSIFIRDSYYELRFFVLAPPGNGVKARANRGNLTW